MTTTFQYHPENTTPRGEWVWVFASNEAGKHNKGNAKVARLHFRAAGGVGSGPTGSAYALATFDSSQKLFPIDRIRSEVGVFLEYARNHPHQNFFVTRIACAPGQLPDQTMATLFAGASENCSLPQAWMPFVMKQLTNTAPAENLNSKETL